MFEEIEAEQSDILAFERGYRGTAFADVAKTKPLLGDRLANTLVGAMEGASKIPGSKYVGGALDAFSNQWSQTAPGRIEDAILGKVEEYAPKLGINSLAAGLLIGAVIPGAGEARLASKVGKASKVAKISKAAKMSDKISELQQLGKKTSSRIDPDEMLRRGTLEPAGFKMNRKEIKAEIVKLQDKVMSLEYAKKQLLGDGETFWIDNQTGEPISIQYNSKDPNKPHMVGWWSRGKRGGKRTLLTEQQSIGPDETAFTKYNAKTNKVELLVKKGDEIHHWNSIIDKSSAYVGLNTQEAKKLTGLVRESGWMFGDNKANLIKMIRSDHKKIHAFMRENGIEGVNARKAMEKLYASKSVEERFAILRGFMEHVQGAVDEELVRMGYQMPPAHAAAQEANRKLLQIK